MRDRAASFAKKKTAQLGQPWHLDPQVVQGVAIDGLDSMHVRLDGVPTFTHGVVPVQPRLSYQDPT